MHRLSKALVGATATATVVAVLGLTASAQAQPASRAVKAGDPKVPAGLETRSA